MLRINSINSSYCLSLCGTLKMNLGLWAFILSFPKRFPSYVHFHSLQSQADLLVIKLIILFSSRPQWSCSLLALTQTLSPKLEHGAKSILNSASLLRKVSAEKMHFIVQLSKQLPPHQGRGPMGLISAPSKQLALDVAFIKTSGDMH